MTTATTPDVTIAIEFRMNGLFDEPAELVQQARQAEQFAAIAAKRGLELGEEGEGAERWFWFSSSGAEVSAVLDELAAAGLMVSLSSEDLLSDQPLAQQLAEHTAVEQVDFAPTAAEVAETEREHAQIAATRRAELAAGLIDPWNYCLRHGMEVRAQVISTRQGPCDLEGWIYPQARHAAGYLSVRITLDDGQVLWGNDTDWRYIEPYTYRPLPDPTPRQVRFDFSLNVVANVPAGEVSDADLREHVRKVLAEDLGHAHDRLKTYGLTLGLDERALPSEQEIVGIYYGNTPADFDRPFDPNAVNDDEDDEED